MKITLDSPRPRRVCVLLLLLAVTASSGCLFLSPDDDDAGLQLYMVARAPQTLERADCFTPEQILSDDRPGALIGVAQIFRRHPTEQRAEKLVRTVPLSVGPLETDGTRALNGIADFDLGKSGSRYRLHARLDFQPEGSVDLLGSWGGRMAFEFGGITVEDVQLNLGQRSGNSYSGAITARLSTSDDLPRPVAFDDFVVDLSSGELSFSYRVNEFVDFDESEPGLDVIVATFRGRIRSTVAFDNDLDLGELSAANGGRRELELLPTDPQCIEVGSQIDGALTLSLHPALVTAASPADLSPSQLGPSELKTTATVALERN